jgi:hypothetical protein
MNKRNIARLGIWLFSVLLLAVALSSCSKEERYDGYFHFSKHGGPMDFNIEMEGETLSVQINGKTSEPSFYTIDNNDNDNSHWFVELDWLRAYYNPKSHNLFVSADENTTGANRKAYVTGFLNGSMKIIEIDQDY